MPPAGAELLVTAEAGTPCPSETAATWDDDPITTWEVAFVTCSWSIVPVPSMLTEAEPVTFSCRIEALPVICAGCELCTVTC